MADIVGKNTPSAEKVHGYVDEIERIEAQIKELQVSRSAIYATAKAEGFTPAGIRYVVKVRKLKPHDRQEAETTRDIYMHAMGMDSEPPLYRQIAAMAKDTAAGEKLLEAFKLLVPPNGELICTIGGKRMRLWRDKEGNAQSELYIPPESSPSIPSSGVAPRAPREVPACTPEEADALGEKAAKENVPVINNPFPYGDPRRPRWDAGWRRGSGNDGLGGAG